MDTVQPRPRGTLAPTVAASCPQLGIYQYGLLVPVYRDNLIDIPVYRKNGTSTARTGISYAKSLHLGEGVRRDPHREEAQVRALERLRRVVDLRHRVQALLLRAGAHHEGLAGLLHLGCLSFKKITTRIRRQVLIEHLKSDIGREVGFV